MATWKTLEDMMIELKKKGVAIPANIMEDLRSAKSMIKLASTEGSHGDAVMKTEEYLANVEAYVVTEGQKVFGSEHVNGWLLGLEEAGACEVCDQPAERETQFVTGVPREQKWVRVEPTVKLSNERIQQLAKEQNLQFRLQKDGRLLIHGESESLKGFVKRMTAETNKQ
ncbi:MAG: DUF2096 family protein [Betaproteobacteria bacterium]